jgi:glycerol uptake facilitator protein
MTSFMGELIGTAMLIVLGAGVCANTNLKKSFANGSGWIVISFGWRLRWLYMQ